MRSLLPFVSRTLATWDLDGPRWRAEEATLAFVDLSGFTRLSERLSRTVKGGAEELNAAISTMWQHLITVVHEFGGDVLQFGGDALLILFTGPDHPLRGAQCLWDLQRTIRREGRIDTEAGPVRLRMSAGLHTDTFHLFVAGEPHRELFVVGPPVTVTCDLESRAEAGQVLVSAELAAALGDNGARRLDDGVSRLDRRPSGSAVIDDLGRGATDVWDRVPAEVAELVGHGATVGEHRWVSVAFVKAGGLDRMLVDAGPDAVLALLDSVSGRVGAAVRRYGVTWLAADVAPDGAKWMLVSGAPIAREDDEDRLLHALCDIRSAEPTLQLGAARGRAFAAEVGHTDRRCYATLGDVTNLAARLQAKAAMNTVLAATELLAHCRAAYHVRPLDPFPVKGKRAAINAVEVEGVAGTVRRTSGPADLVGRHDHRAAISDLVTALVAGDGHALAFLGERGIGKSALVDAAVVAAEAAGVDVARGIPDTFGAGAPYASVRPALCSALGIRSSDTATVHDELRAIASSVSGPASSMKAELVRLAAPAVSGEIVQSASEPADDLILERRAAAIVALLRAARRTRGPVLFVFDDADRYDDASSSIVARLGLATHEQPWGVLAAARVSTPALDPLRTLVLEGLADREARQFVIAAAADRGLRDDTLAWIVGRSAGNPFTLSELTEALAGRSERDPADLPDSIERMVSVRIDMLPVRLRTVVRELSVAGDTISLDAVATVLDAAPPTDAEWTQLAPFLLRHQDSVAFTSEIVRSAAYGGLANRRKRQLHGRVAQLLSSGDRPEPGALGFHLLQARQYLPSFLASLEAGERARSTGAFADAAEFYQRALDAAPPNAGVVAPDERARVAELLGDALERVARLDQSDRAYRASAAAADRGPLERARLLRKRARVAMLAGEYLTARRRLGRARRTLESLSAAKEVWIERAEVEFTECWVAFYRSDWSRALAAATKNLELAARSGEERLIALAHVNLEMAYGELGDPRGEHHGRSALHHFESLGDDYGLGTTSLNLAVGAFVMGEWRRSRELLDRAVDAHRGCGNVTGEAYAFNNLGELCCAQGRYDEARDHVQRARRLFRSIGSEHGVALATSGLSRVELYEGHTAAALDLLDHARETFERLGAAAYIADTDARIVEARLYWDDLESELDPAELSLPPATAERLSCLSAWRRSPSGVTGDRIVAAFRVALDRGEWFEALAVAALAEQVDGERTLLRPEADQLVARLDVVRLPPLPSPVSRGR